MMTPEFPLIIEEGADFNHTFNWYDEKFMAPIEAITVGYPTLIRVTGHGLNFTSDTPVVISGVDGCPDLNSSDTGIELAHPVDQDTFEMPVSTVADEWVAGTGEMTYWKPADIAGYGARMQIRKSWHSKDIILELTTENGMITLDPTDCSIQLRIPSNVTRDIQCAKAVYDLELLDHPVDPENSYVIRLFQGPVTITREVTR